MTQIVNVHEAKTHFSHFLDRAHAGEEIILAKAGKPYARLVPLVDPEPKKPRVPGIWSYEVPDSFFDPLPEEEIRAWEGG